MLDSLIRSWNYPDPVPARPASDARLRAMRRQLGIAARTDPDSFWELDRAVTLGLELDELERFDQLTNTTEDRS